MPLSDEPTRRSPSSPTLVHTLVRWLDDHYLDPIIGLLLPGAGDLLSSALGVALVREAAARGLPPAILARMLLNLAVDALFGSIPVAGDVFDVFWKANKKNLALLESRAAAGAARPADYLVVGLAALLLLAALCLPVALLVWALGRL